MAVALLSLKMGSKAGRDPKPSNPSCLSLKTRGVDSHTVLSHAEATSSEERDQVEQILTTGSVCTFARQWVESNPGKKQAVKECLQLVITPYFGNFAGRKMTFSVKRNSRNISVRVEGSSEKGNVYCQPDAKLVGVRDQCLKFVHGDASKNEPIPGFKRKPLSLAFLCEQTALVHLDKLKVDKMPVKYQELFRGTAQQDVAIHIWPRSLYKTPIIMRVKRNIALSEFEWMLCHRLSLPNPSHITLYHKDFIHPLVMSGEDDVTLLPEHRELHCVLSPSIYHDLGASRNERTVVVSVMEHGIKDITVHRSMQLHHFERIIRQEFNLHSDSFLYIPEVISMQSAIKMSILLGEDNLDILSSSSRNLPLIQGIGSLSVKKMYKNLPLYDKTIEELNLLKYSLITVFEVTGPTVPIEFRRFSDGVAGGSNPAGSRSSGENFVFITEKASAVSINPSWTVPTLLHYVDCMTAFPYTDIRIGTKLVDGKVGKYLAKQWTKKEKGQLCLKTKLPHMTCGLH